MNERELIKEIKESIKPIKDGLFKFDELEELCSKILNFINKKTKTNKLWQLRLRRFYEDHSGVRINVDPGDYASAKRTFSGISAWDRFEPFFNFIRSFLNESKVVERIEDDDLWVESRTQGKESHLFIGNKKGDKEKVHLILNETGVPRIDKNDSPPGALFDKVRSTLTTKDGKIIESYYEFK